MFTLQRHRQSGPQSVNIWPGFVDALSALLMVVIFVLMIFMVAQFYLSNLLTGREETVSRLNQQVEELSDLLDVERDENMELRTQVSSLSADLQETVQERDAVVSQLEQVSADRDDLDGQLADAIRANRELTDEVEDLDRSLADAHESIESDRESIELQLQEIASLQADVQALRSVRDDLEMQVATMTLMREVADRQVSTLEAEVADRETALSLSEEERAALMEEMAALRDRSTVLETELSSAEERTMLAQREIEQRDTRIETLMARISDTEAALAEQLELTAEADEQRLVMAADLFSLRQQLRRVERALAESEAAVDDQDLEIASLNARLNQALVREVEELSQYRSEFFGRMREVLAGREDVRIVGDRFVFQSEVLFPSASAELQGTGQAQLAQLAQELTSIASEFPEDIDWILRVDGHTDSRPISTPDFPSNWELSTARALEVVKFLADEGIPEERLAAAGFGEFQPVEEGSGQDVWERNRRIELQLDRRGHTNALQMEPATDGGAVTPAVAVDDD